jgi:hypothetical protein
VPARLAFALGSAASLTVLTLSGCERADGSSLPPGSYTVRESGVAMRAGPAACAAHPGTGSCPDVLLGLRPGQRLYPVCQRRGQMVGRNPYWLYASGPRGKRGWVASWYIDHPANRLPGVADCTEASFKPPRFDQ